MRNVLIISEYFPPRNAIASRRFGYMAGYMEEFGWKPWVITRPSTGDLPVKIPEQQIVRVGAETGVSSPGKMPYWTLRAAAHRWQVLASRWYWQVISERAALDRVPKPDVIVASYGPNSALLLGRHLSKHYGAPWIADFRDPGALRQASATRIGVFMNQLAERVVLRSAWGITTAGGRWSRMMTVAYRRPAETVYNGYEYSSEDVERAPFEGGEAGLAGQYLYYAGTIYEHQVQAATVVFDALASFAGVNFYLRLLGRAEAVDEIKRQLAARGIGQQVVVMPRSPAAVALREANRSFANVVFGDLSAGRSWTAGHLTGKFLELLALGPPLLVVAGTDSDFGSVLACTGKGRVCGNAGEVRDFLRAAGTGNPYPGNRREIERYSRRNQCKALCEVLSQAAEDAKGTARRGW